MSVETTIRYTVDNLGLIGDDGLVMAGDLGRYLGAMRGEEGWLRTEPSKHPGKVCPVSRGMVEVAS
jgi:hypothetical protein